MYLKFTRMLNVFIAAAVMTRSNIQNTLLRAYLENIKKAIASHWVDLHKDFGAYAQCESRLVLRCCEY